jgi:hypothetical protein
MTRRFLVVLALVGIVASGCTLGPRQTWADSIRHARRTAERSGGSKVHVDVKLRVIQTTIRVVPSPLFVTLDGVVDYKNRKSRLVATGGAGFAKRATVYYDDLVTFLQRSPSSIADHDPDRHWARFDFSDKPKPDKIDATDRLQSLGYVISPGLAVELLNGVLAGSLKQVGASQIDGEPVTEYYGKLAPDAVTRDLRKQERVDGITRMFKILGVSADLFPVHVWMDAKGLARKIEFSLKQQEDVVDQFRTTVVYTFSDYGPPPQIRLPERGDCVGHKRFVDFVGEYTRSAI